jgi:hypothetical protein
LTASSRLQHLDINDSVLPAGVALEHIFPADRQLLHLRALSLACITFADSADVEFCDSVSPLQGTRLVSCCPALQYLDLTEWARSAGQLLAPLQGLSDLRTLLVNCPDPTGAVLQEVCQLTGLRELDFTRRQICKPGMMQLSLLKQLTHLVYEDDEDWMDAVQVCG